MKGKILCVFEELEKGPATCHDVANATGIYWRICAVYLSQFYRDGLATRTEVRRGGKGAPERVYSLRSVA